MATIFRKNEWFSVSVVDLCGVQYHTTCVQKYVGFGFGVDFSVQQMKKIKGENRRIPIYVAQFFWGSEGMTEE